MTTKNINETKSSAKWLRIIANIGLVLGVAVGIVILSKTAMIDSGEYTYKEDKVFNPMSILYAIAPVFFALVLWAFAYALADVVDNTSITNKLISYLNRISAQHNEA